MKSDQQSSKKTKFKYSEKSKHENKSISPIINGNLQLPALEEIKIDTNSIHKKLENLHLNS